MSDDSNGEEETSKENQGERPLYAGATAFHQEGKERNNTGKMET
jgi:hypothetical protein